MIASDGLCCRAAQHIPAYAQRLVDMYNKKGEIDRILDEGAFAMEYKKQMEGRPKREPQAIWEKLYGVQEDFGYTEDGATRHRNELLSLALAYGVVTLVLKYFFDSGIIHP